MGTSKYSACVPRHFCNAVWQMIHAGAFKCCANEMSIKPFVHSIEMWQFEVKNGCDYSVGPGLGDIRCLSQMKGIMSSYC